ncbi:MAG: PEP-CTERM sorting domain-containing protein [Crocosphaera sp.]
MQKQWVTTTIILGLTGFGTLNAQAATILSTDFDGRTVSGATASNLNWITNGVSDPGDLTADFNLFDTAATQDLFAVDRNIQNEGPWTVDIPVEVGSQGIELDEITLDAYIFNNSGNQQNFSLDFDLTIDLLDSTQTNVLATDSVVDQFPNSVGSSIPNPSPLPFVFDFTGNILEANTTFFLRLTASGEGPGNNGGIDNLVVTGNFVGVPEPSTIMGLGLLATFGIGRGLKGKLAKAKKK